MTYFKKNIRPINDTEWELVQKWYQETRGYDMEDLENMEQYRENAVVLENYIEDGPGYFGPVIFFVAGYINYVRTWTLRTPERDGEAYLEEVIPDNIPTEKRFACIWLDGYYDAGVKETGITVFTEDEGYTKEDIQRIKNLQVGQNCAFDGGHIVTRIK